MRTKRRQKEESESEDESSQSEESDLSEPDSPELKLEYASTNLMTEPNVAIGDIRTEELTID